MPVGILTPDWLQNAQYLGKEKVASIDCYKWTKSEFITYWESIETRKPIRWIFLWDGAQFDIIDFRENVTVSDELWQVPQYCFNDTSARTQL